MTQHYFYALHHRIHRIKDRQENRQHNKENDCSDKDDHQRLGKRLNPRGIRSRASSAIIRRMLQEAFQIACRLPRSKHSAQEGGQVRLMQDDLRPTL